MDDQVLTLYSMELTSRDIVDAFKEMYDADASATLVLKITDRVLEQVTDWQSRLLDTIYPIVYIDCVAL
jgi:putative transposase